MSALLNKCVTCHNAQGLLVLGLSKFNHWLNTPDIINYATFMQLLPTLLLSL